MLTIPYLANGFPCEVEPYVAQEIEELRSRGVQVITGSVRKVNEAEHSGAEIVLQRDAWRSFIRAGWLCLRRGPRLVPTIFHVVFRSKENFRQRCKTLVHTVLGACYAALLERRGVEHIHVHHGYFGSWIAMTAARLLDVGFSMTLHGSDLLQHAKYLDVKLANCDFCLTVSEYNRRYILQRYPQVDPANVVVSRLGAEVPRHESISPSKVQQSGKLNLLSVGRLHPVKDQAFLLQACSRLETSAVDFHLYLAGEGTERRRLQSLSSEYGLEARVNFLGHVPPDRLAVWYERADIVVLTSRSEGIPLVLMEAMARGKIVLAPAITGIPELVLAGKTGFLYEPGSIRDFLDHLILIHRLMEAEAENDPTDLSADSTLVRMRRAARDHVLQNFDRDKNLKLFADRFLDRVAPLSESIPNENPILQQI